MPSCFKCSTIILVSKKSTFAGLIEYRPVVVMKSFEGLVLKQDITDPLLDPLQFAPYILHHLDQPGMYARILFVDLSLAFNTVILDILQGKFNQLTVPASSCQ